MLYAWMGLAAGVSVWMNICHMRLIGKGRILSRPFYRIFRRPPWTRGNQIILWMLGTWIEGFVHPLPRSIEFPIFYLIFIAWYLDDYFTGDDDKWKKFWGLVRNKVKWKMDLPVTSHAR